MNVQERCGVSAMQRPRSSGGICTAARASLLLLFATLAGCATEMEPYREVSCLGHARVSLAQAVTRAESSGGRAVDAAYREPREMGCLEGFPGYYDVTVLADGRLDRLSVDAASGDVVPRIQQSFLRRLAGQWVELLSEGSSESRIPAAQEATVRMVDAVRVTESHGGNALEARVARESGGVGYRVKVVQQNRLRIDWVPGS